MNSDIKRYGTNDRYSKAVVHNGVVYLAGQVASEAVPSAADQARMILNQIDDWLAQCGTDKTRLLTATVVFSDLRDFDKVNEVWDAWVAPGCQPTRTPLQSKLITPQHLVAIQVTAALRVRGGDIAHT